MQYVNQFFIDMSYSIEQQLSNDFDILLWDGIKLIHIATAGGILPPKLSETENDFKQQIREVYRYRRVFSIIQNTNLERGNITDLKNYLTFFSYMSIRGFYSYDKVNIDDVEDQTYQLISRPNYNRNVHIVKFSNEIQPLERLRYPLNTRINLIQTNREFPGDFNEFNLIDFI